MRFIDDSAVTYFLGHRVYLHCGRVAHCKWYELNYDAGDSARVPSLAAA